MGSSYGDSRYNNMNLPIFKSALKLCVYIETIVRGFDKYNKYTIGENLRNNSKELVFLINHANIRKDKQKLVKLELLRDKCEDMKMIIMLAKELKSFVNFNQFLNSSKLAVEICRQAQAWFSNHQTRCQSL